ncbi:hypothetical protein GIB67_014089 [Kingdonia uniflora]|uniref:DUF4283 domain-containing protein n=1 Tax=Kingdonia uniflora TaxID=39325 RepID=A0A7J7KXE5_9MAGN|nr:hypothetical protein GIB67_014089 [Kingdonia uniflora]
MENASLHGKIPDKVMNTDKSTQSYADLVRGSKNIPNEAPTLLEVGKRGDTPFILILEGEVVIGVSQFNYSLIGRLDLQKVKFIDVQKCARNKWKISGQCKLIPLGKGFFITKLDNEIDKIYVWSHGPWIVEKMSMRLMPRSLFFSVDNHKNTNALIWCKFSGLPSELWSLKIILSLGKTLGTPIQVDQSTLNHDYRYYASVLVDIDLSQSIPNHVFIHIEGKMINQEIILHRVPKFCNHCKNVGHCIAECKIVCGFTEQNFGARCYKFPVIINVPWLRFGDFNTVLRMSEKKRGRKPPCRRAVAEFSNVINAAYLIESITSGITYTWCNGQKGVMRILSVLDRSLINDRWNAKFQS